MKWRSRIQANDRDGVRRLVEATGFFSGEEQDVAVELIDEAWAQGSKSGYEFIFADAPGNESDLQGYACFGPIDPGGSGFDLYWIVVSPQIQRKGLGKKLLQEAELRAMAQGATEMFIETSGREQYRPTRRFYARMGYRQHEIVPDFYSVGDDKVVYKKQLANAAAT